MTKKQYQRYSPEFKIHALKRASEDGVTDKAVSATARVLAANTEIVNTATVSVGLGPNQQVTNPKSNITSGSVPEPIPGLNGMQRVMLSILMLLLALIFIRNSDRIGRRAS